MEYQKIINLLDNAPNQPSKFRTKNWVGINDESRGTYITGAQIKFKTTMLKSSLLVKGNITLNDTSADDADGNNTNKKVIFRNCAPFTDYISEMNTTQVDNAKSFDILMPLYNLIKIIQKHLEVYSNIVKIYQL